MYLRSQDCIYKWKKQFWSFVCMTDHICACLHNSITWSDCNDKLIAELLWSSYRFFPLLFCGHMYCKKRCSRRTCSVFQGCTDVTSTCHPYRHSIQVWSQCHPNFIPYLVLKIISRRKLKLLRMRISTTLTHHLFLIVKAIMFLRFRFDKTAPRHLYFLFFVRFHLVYCSVPYVHSWV